MHENIETKIVELKEIALQIMNIMDTKDTLWSSYAYTKLLSMQDGRLTKEIVYQGYTQAQGYDMWITRLLIDLQQWRGNDGRQYKALLKEYQAYFRGKQNTGKLAEKANPLWQLIRGIGD